MVLVSTSNFPPWTITPGLSPEIGKFEEMSVNYDGSSIKRFNVVYNWIDENNKEHKRINTDVVFNHIGDLYTIKTPVTVYARKISDEYPFCVVNVRMFLHENGYLEPFIVIESKLTS